MSFSNRLSSFPGDVHSSIPGHTSTMTLTSVVASYTVPTSSSPTSAVSNAATLSTGIASASNAASSDDSGDGSDDSQSNSGNKTTVIVLATLMSIVGACLIAGAILAFIRCRRRRTKLFSRGITPIDDEEIETWKGNRVEKSLEDGAELTARLESRGHQKHESVSSTKKPPSLIVYSRRSEERFHPRSPPMTGLHSKMSFDGGKMSLDKELPFTPIQARAPNAREGLTDEAIPGDQPFIPSPKRQTSRLSKTHPRSPRQAHTRNKSSRSTISLNHIYNMDGYNNQGYESDVDITSRASHDQHRFHPHHSRVLSTSSIPPRLSLSDDWPSGGLSPRPLIVRREDIGRAIG